MSSVQEESGFLSLADLAQADVSDVSVLLSRNPGAGVYRVRCTGVAGKEVPSKEPAKPAHFAFSYNFEVISARLVDKKADPETLVGKKMTQQYRIFQNGPNDLAEGIGLLKGNYQKAGLPNSGAMGGLEGVDPGWVDGAVNHEFDIRVRTYQNNGQEQVAFDWLTPEQSKAGV